MPNKKDKAKPTFKLEVSDLDPETYLAVQQANSDHLSVMSGQSSKVPNRTNPALSLAHNTNTTLSKSQRDPPFADYLSLLDKSAGFFKFQVRRSGRIGRAGRPRGSRASRPRIGSYTSHFATVAKNLSYRGCLTDLLSHEGRLSRLQALDKNLASTFQKYIDDHNQAKRAKEAGSTSQQLYEPIFPPSNEVQGSVETPIFPDVLTNLEPENTPYSSKSSPKAGPSGLQSSRHFPFGDQMYQGAEFDPILHEERETYEQAYRSIETSAPQECEPKDESGTPYNDASKSQEEVSLNKNPVDVIEILDSDSEGESLENPQAETYMSDLSLYYAPPSVAPKSPTDTVSPPILMVNSPSVPVYQPPKKENPPKLALYPPKLTMNPPSTQMNQPQSLKPSNMTAISDDQNSSQLTMPNPFRGRTQNRTQSRVPGTYIKLTGSHFYGTRNVEFDAPAPTLSRDSSEENKKSTSPPEITAEPLMGSPSYDVPELDLFNNDGLSEALSYINPEYNQPKRPAQKIENPPEAPGPSEINPPKKRGQKSSRRKSTVRLATPRPARPSRAKTARSISGIRSTFSDLTQLCGKVTTTEKYTLPCGEKVFVGGGLPTFRIPPTAEVRKIATEATALGHTIRSSDPDQEEEVLEDIVSWLMDNPAEVEYQKKHPQ